MRTFVTQDEQKRLSELEMMKKSLELQLQEMAKTVEAQQEQIAMARRDPLTGLRNRAGVAEQINAILKAGGKGAFFIMDMDNFKAVNDTYGHDNGDAVLIRLGEILKEISRVNGFAGRFGGEEFMIFLFGEDTSIQAHIINQVCKKLRETDFSFTDRHITLSVGVTDIKNGDTLEECIERADKALYYSKQNGKNQVNWYEEVIDKK